MSAPSEALYDADAMRALDGWAVGEAGAEGMVLMESAGRQLADAVDEAYPTGAVVVLCGGGNNGGDGYVAARVLRDGGRAVHVVAVADPSSLRGDAATALQRLSGDPPVPFAEETLSAGAVVIDALLGTGTTGAPRGAVADVIACVNRSGLPVVAADVPSGVDASTGETPGPAIQAQLTVTFAAHKLGLWIAPGKHHSGEIRVAQLPYPGRWPVAESGNLLGSDAVSVIGPRGAESTKFTSGHVLIVGGSSGLSGAPILAAAGAMRAGAGYVTMGVPSALAPAVDQHLVEAMPIPLPGPTDHHDPVNAEVLTKHLATRGGALVLGPGLGTSDGARELVLSLVGVTAPLVLDADGLNAVSGTIEVLASRAAPTVLTPHAGELARLLGVSSEEVSARRVHHARMAAELSGAVVVLKGDDTIIAHPGAPEVAVSRGGAPGLATAGTGDVLAGVVGALLAAGHAPGEAAAAAVVLHTEAGRQAAARIGCADGVIASDVVRALPAALAALRSSDVAR